MEFTRTALKDVGIYVRDEHATPVGDKPTNELMADWVCPHIIGGIPLGVVSKIYDMTRDARGEKFTGMGGWKTSRDVIRAPPGSRGGVLPP